MASDYKVLNVFQSEEIEYLRLMYERYPKEFWARDYNLFNLYKCSIPKGLDKQDIDFLCKVTDKIKLSINYKKNVEHYFLKYIAGSFTHIHVDNPKRIKATAVTLLDLSSDIVGGDTLLVKNVTEEDIRPGNMRPDKILDNMKVPTIIKFEVGSTLIYDHNVRHGVTKVEQGCRLVLITWFS